MVWDLRICIHLILLCLRSKGGDYYSNLIHLLHEFLKLGIILLMSSCRRLLSLIPLIVGVVVASRMIIIRGTRWRVGDGLQIRIWRDSWLPRDHFYHILSPLSTGVHPFLTVRSIIVEDAGVLWNSNLVRSWFVEEEAELILSIPLSLFLPADSLIWAKEPNGLLITKSAYFVVRSCPGMGGEEPTVSMVSEKTKFLSKALWWPKVPGKVKICAWWGCMNVLPSKVNLKKR